jgi:hypothetical protein
VLHRDAAPFGLGGERGGDSADSIEADDTFRVVEVHLSRVEALVP